ncbi:peptidylprolyl isomerase [Bacillus massiliigorillae]|uniref:peptidylprolyl isomerase n=1 Tax=Bacillus massiliigorillae TaxID=1243664 RepID=UPI00039D11B2|nr:peptidylprolyl isomerase [Bacillus massiliigorillae]
MKKILFVSLLLVVILAACGTKEEKVNFKSSDNENLSIENYPQFMPVQAEEKVVSMETSKGIIKLKLFPEYAPKAVENFVTHAENGYYNGLTFHRVLKDFMIQGGDPEGTGMGGESIWKKPFKDEFSNKLYHFRGALSMANSGANTNGSQFFIVQAPKVENDQAIMDAYPEAVANAYKEKGGTPWLDNKHTVFGQVIEGMDIVDAIADVEVDRQGKPAEKVIIKSMKVIQ